MMATCSGVLLDVSFSDFTVFYKGLIKVTHREGARVERRECALVRVVEIPD